MEIWSKEKDISGLVGHFADGQPVMAVIDFERGDGQHFLVAKYY